MKRALAWLRFGGWRGNAYWREDWAMATCPHPTDAWVADDQITLCGDCGAVLA